MKIYLNNAATSYPKPAAVVEAVKEATAGLPGAGHRGGIESYSVFDQTREELCLLTAVGDGNSFALGANATWGLNLGLFGFPFKQGDIVLTTRAEHNSVLRPLHILEKRGLIKTIFLPTDDTGRIDPEVWYQALTEAKVCLAVFTHASNVTGAVNDAQLLTEMAKEKGAAVFLDASQSLGLVSVIPEAWDVDLMAFTGHKYLLGPQGTGGLYVKPGLELTPHLVGGTGIYSDAVEMPAEMPLHLEAGTGNDTSYAGLAAALAWSRENPLDFIELEKVTNHLKEGLTQAGAAVIDPGGLCTPVVSFVVPGVSFEDIGFLLTEGYDIICRTGLHCAPLIHQNLRYNEGGTVRLSLSRFTTREEVEIVIEAVMQIVQGGGI